MRVALLYNPRPDGVPEGMPDDVYEEFDGADTIGAICGALTELGVAVEPVIADRSLPRVLEHGGFDFAFNIAEGSGRRNREAVPAAVCELFGIPYTGSDPLTLAVTLDKWIARRLVSPEVPVAPAVLVRARSDCEKLNGLRYPAIVKPNDEGSSKGIRGDAIARSAEEAATRSQWLREAYDCPVLVEEFLSGPEVTVGILGNGAAKRIVALMEIEPVTSTGQFVYSLEVKRDYRRQVRYHVPPRLPAGVLKNVERLALQAYDVLGCRDVGRIDFRLSAAGVPHFLECNPLPGLNAESGDLVILSRAVMSHGDLVRQILKEAAMRTGVRLP